MNLKTKRLLLRPLKDADAKHLVEGVGNVDVSKWLLVVAHPYRLKDAKSWIASNKKKWRVKKKTDYTFGIELVSEKKVIGAIGLHKVDMFGGTSETGYWINAEYHGQGYGNEALAAVLTFAFTKLKLRRINAGVFEGNPSSGKLLERFGAKREGYRKASRKCLADGKIKDEILYGLLREDWKPLSRRA